MKKLILVFSIFSIFSAYAQSIQDELMTQIGFGSTITFLRDINIPGKGRLIVSNGGEFKYFSQVVGDRPGCRITASDQDNYLVNRDVKLRAGEVVTAFRRATADTGELLEFRTEESNIISIFCWKGMNTSGSGKGVPTIGELGIALDGVAILQLDSEEN